MELLKVTNTKEVSLGGTDLKGAAYIVNGDIELLEIEMVTQNGLQSLRRTKLQQIRSLSNELNQLLKLIDSDIMEVDYEPADKSI